MQRKECCKALDGGIWGHSGGGKGAFLMSWDWIRAGGWFWYEKKQSNANPALWFLYLLIYGAISLKQNMSLLLMALTAKIASRLAFLLH